MYWLVYNWGKPQMPSIIKGGSMNEWDADKHKWAIKVDADGMILQFFHDSNEDAPLELQHMTKFFRPKVK